MVRRARRGRPDRGRRGARAAGESKVVRKRGISDGPFIETKEVLGGFIIVEVESEAVALEMARTWPGIVHDSDRVEVWPVGSSESEAAAQAQREAADGQQNAGSPEAAG